jgi:hypothetical protein
MEDIALTCLPKDADDNEESSDGEDNLQVPMIWTGSEAGSQTSSLTWSQAPAKSKSANPTSSVARQCLALRHIVDSSYPEEDYPIKCICTYTDDDGNTVFCETCETWQHIVCYYPGYSVPGLHFCGDCRPRSLDGKRAIERQKRLREHRSLSEVGLDAGKRQEQQQGPWTTQEDEILCDYRNRRYDWVQIQQKHFPDRSADACRERYERLLQEEENFWVLGAADRCT